MALTLASRWPEKEAPAVVAQAPFELDMLIKVFQMVRPKRALEIGVWHGGTLWHWLQGCDHVVAVDDQMLERDQWKGWGHEIGCDLTLLQGGSGDPAIVGAAERRGPYEFVLIDADHTYSSVRRDFDNYRPMVAPGGVVCFHDIQPREGYGVSQLWEELKNEPGARTAEFLQRQPYECEGLTRGYEPGIGVLWC